jgi:hypothetical protein
MSLQGARREVINRGHDRVEHVVAVQDDLNQGDVLPQLRVILFSRIRC